MTRRASTPPAQPRVVQRRSAGRLELGPNVARQVLRRRDQAPGPYFSVIGFVEQQLAELRPRHLLGGAEQPGDLVQADLLWVSRQIAGASAGESAPSRGARGATARSVKINGLVAVPVTSS